MNTKPQDKDDKTEQPIPGKYPPPAQPGVDEPFPTGSTVEETNSDREIEGKQTVSGD
jgi:hypothetical protein